MKLGNIIKMTRRAVRFPVLFALTHTMIFISHVFPRVTWLKFCGTLGILYYHLSSRYRALANKHLTMVYGSEKSDDEIQRMVKKVFQMMGTNAGEIIRSYRVGSLKEFDQIRETAGIEHVERAFAKGKGVIFLVAHIGAFELMATEMALRGYKPYIIGTPLKDRRLNDLLWKQRGKLGATAVERGKDTIKLMKNLKSGGTMAILIDQDTRVKSRFVNFFGIPCATPIGATILAMKTGAAVVPTFIHLREDYVQQIDCYPEIELTRTGDEEHDVLVNTQKFNDVIEDEIRKYPEQWVWIHERWKTKPGEEMV
jgi:Kdo2-lipid IVA lauroyltransferase/acyltransferase